MEENIVMEIEVEEDIFDKIAGMTAEMNQMERMIAENVRLIAEGDDVEGRTFMKSHLENEVTKLKYKIAKLKKQLEAEIGE